MISTFASRLYLSSKWDCPMRSSTFVMVWPSVYSGSLESLPRKKNLSISFGKNIEIIIRNLLS